jgi:hypothetical protein
VRRNGTKHPPASPAEGNTDNRHAANTRGARTPDTTNPRQDRPTADCQPRPQAPLPRNGGAIHAPAMFGVHARGRDPSHLRASTPIPLTSTRLRLSGGGGTPSRKPVPDRRFYSGTCSPQYERGSPGDPHSCPSARRRTRSTLNRRLVLSDGSHARCPVGVAVGPGSPTVVVPAGASLRVVLHRSRVRCAASGALDRLPPTLHPAPTYGNDAPVRAHHPARSSTTPVPAWSPPELCCYFKSRQAR